MQMDQSTGRPAAESEPLCEARHAHAQRLRIIAHQGAQGTFPSNSLPALEAAFGVADCVELDVYLATRQDGLREIVVIHPEGYYLYVDKAGMQNERPLPLTFEETQSIRVRGERLIPTLNEVLDSYARLSTLRGKRTELQIELKGPGTAAEVIPLLRSRIERGEMDAGDVALTSLCYPGDRSRLLEARSLDRNMRLVLVIRGGDLKADGFSSLDEVIDFGRQIGADTITGSRRLLTPRDIAQIRSAGFRAGCYHSRTTDELEAAIALGADYVAADFYRGADIQEYPEARPLGDPLFVELSNSGFYILRDWIWELGWECEKLRDSLPTYADACSARGDGSAEAIFCHDSAIDGPILLQLCRGGELSSDVLDFSDVSINEKFYGGIDRLAARRAELPLAFGDLLSRSGQETVFAALVSQLGNNIQNSLHTPNSERPFNLSEIVALAETSRADLHSELPPQHLSDEVQLGRELARAFLTRTGRIIGMLAFTALNPRHSPKDSYTVVIDSDLCRSSFWARFGAEQQVSAQLLRSGKLGKAKFI